MLARVAEIKESVDVEVFKYIKSEDNSAYPLTRGIPNNQLAAWMKGPRFLRLRDDDCIFSNIWEENEEPQRKDIKQEEKQFPEFASTTVPANDGLLLKAGVRDEQLDSLSTFGNQGSQATVSCASTSGEDYHSRSVGKGRGMIALTAHVTQIFYLQSAVARIERYANKALL